MKKQAVQTYFVFKYRFINNGKARFSPKILNKVFKLCFDMLKFLLNKW